MEVSGLSAMTETWQCRRYLHARYPDHVYPELGSLIEAFVRSDLARVAFDIAKWGCKEAKNGQTQAVCGNNGLA